MPHNAVPVAPEDVPFDVQVQDAPVKASPLEIECACMTAHGATAAVIATRFGINESVVNRLRRKAHVKRLVERYAKDAGLAGADLLNVGFVHAARKLLALVDSGDARISLDATKSFAKLVLDMQKMSVSLVQVNLLQGVTVQARAMEKTNQELRADALHAHSVMERFLESKDASIGAEVKP